MPRRIILHAGFHKTGTSTVQQVLRANRLILKPVLAMRLKGQMQELMHATRGYSTWRDPLTLAKATRRFGAVLDGLAAMPRRALVISAEELSGHMPGRNELMDYSAAPILLANFCEEITARFPEAEQVIYFSTREPNSWLKSAYWQHVRSSSMTLDYSEFSNIYEKSSDLTSVVNQVRNAVKAEVFEASLEDSKNDPLGPASALLDLCQIPSDIREKLIPQEPINQRLDQAVLLDLLEANRAYEDRDERKAAKQIILAETGKNV